MRPDDRDSTTKSAVTWRSASRNGSSAVKIRSGATSGAAGFGYIPAIRDSMQRVWYARWFEAVAALLRDIRVSVRSPGARRTRRHRRRHARSASAPAAIFSVARRCYGHSSITTRLGDLHTSEHARTGTRTSGSRAGDRRLQVAREDDRGLRGFLDDRLHAHRSRGVAHGQSGRREWIVFRRHGPSAGARPPAQFIGRRAERARRGRADVSLLDDGARERPVARRQDHHSRRPEREDRRRPRTVLCRILPTPKSSRTSSPARITSAPRWSLERTHCMTDPFGRLAPGVTLEQARAELVDVHAP